MPSLTSLVSRLNRSDLAQRHEVRAWGGRYRGTSFDRLLYLYLHKFHVLGQHERALFERRVKPGMTVLDVGANIGLYTCTLSRLVGDAGQVYAFEPEPALFRCLEQNCAANGARNVHLHNVAVGDAGGSATIVRSAVNFGDTRLWGEASDSGTPVRVVTLDEAVGAIRPDFVKMDIQGYELKALRGMARILRDTPSLMIYLEFWPFGLRSNGDDPSTLLDLLAAESFTLYSDDGAERPIADPAAFCRTLDGKSYSHVLAVRS